MGPNPVWLVSLSEEEIWTKRHQGWACTEERPCEDTERRHSSASQGERPLEKAATLILSFKPQNHKKINFCCLNYPDCGIYYGSLSKLIQRGFSQGPGGPSALSWGPYGISKLFRPLVPCFLHPMLSLSFIVLTLLAHCSLFNKGCLLWPLGDLKDVWMFVNNLFFWCASFWYGIKITGRRY